ncbi:MAG: hypothetical protein ACLP51_09965 [Syntrophobacteraceae bacterium]
MSRPVLPTNLFRKPPIPLLVDVVGTVCRSSHSIKSHTPEWMKLKGALYRLYKICARWQ